MDSLPPHVAPLIPDEAVRPAYLRHRAALRQVQPGLRLETADADAKPRAGASSLDERRADEMERRRRAERAASLRRARASVDNAAPWRPPPQRGPSSCAWRKEAALQAERAKHAAALAATRPTITTQTQRKAGRQSRQHSLSRGASRDFGGGGHGADSARRPVTPPATEDAHRQRRGKAPLPVPDAGARVAHAAMVARGRRRGGGVREQQRAPHKLAAGARGAFDAHSKEQASVGKPNQLGAHEVQIHMDAHWRMLGSAKAAPPQEPGQPRRTWREILYPEEEAARKPGGALYTKYQPRAKVDFAFDSGFGDDELIEQGNALDKERRRLQEAAKRKERELAELRAMLEQADAPSKQSSSSIASDTSFGSEAGHAWRVRVGFESERSWGSGYASSDSSEDSEGSGGGTSPSSSSAAASSDSDERSRNRDSRFATSSSDRTSSLFSSEGGSESAHESHTGYSEDEKPPAVEPAKAAATKWGSSSEEEEFKGDGHGGQDAAQHQDWFASASEDESYGSDV